jgi:cytochrome c553
MSRASLSLVVAASLFAAPSEVLVLPEGMRGACEQEPACSGAKRQVDVRFAAGRIASLEDAGGTPRLRFNRGETLAEILREVKVWRLGREVYDAQCARCHGSDGKLEDYPGVKSLAGIGERYSETRIIEAVQNGGRVDMSGMTQSERHALAVYVAGL